MSKVWFYPDEHNAYLDLMRKAIESCGSTLLPNASLKSYLKADILHLNWYENLPDGRLERIIKFTFKSALLCMAKLFRKRVVFVLHNKRPHENVSGLCVRLMNRLIRSADNVIIHSKCSMALLPTRDGIVYVPHPNFVDAYPAGKRYDVLKREKSQKILLFIGAVQPYKNVATVLRVAERFSEEKDLIFWICGKPASKEYGDMLVQTAKTDNVRFDLRYIRDDEIASLMDMADAVIQPYDTTSALNSGAAILAFSYGKTVVSTDTGTIRDLEDSGLVYCYEYSSDPGIHADRLEASIQKLLADLRSDQDILKKKGNALREKMLMDNDIHMTAKSLQKCGYGKRR